MLILLGLLLLMGASYYGMKKSDYWSAWHSTFFIFTSTLGTIISVTLLALILVHASAGASVAQYHQTKETIAESRSGNVSDIERAALTQTIIETNMIIASHKYWNETILDLYYPDKIAELEPLK